MVHVHAASHALSVALGQLPMVEGEHFCDPLRRFATAPPERGSVFWRLQLAVAAGACACFSAEIFCLYVIRFPLPFQGRGSGGLNWCLSVASRPLSLEGGAMSTDSGWREKQAPVQISAPKLSDDSTPSLLKGGGQGEGCIVAPPSLCDSFRWRGSGVWRR